jgi:predicted CXXCH cytochrome family protein
MSKPGSIIQGDGVCYSCHGPSTALPFGDMSAFEGSAHMDVADPPSGSKVKCMACHDAHASRNTRLTTYTGFMVCVQCHNTGTDAEPDIWSKLQLNADANAKHSLLPADQTTGARMQCQNCHSTHALTADTPLVDPHDPGPTGVWTGHGTQRSFCFRCHDGTPLPTASETAPWAGAVLGAPRTPGGSPETTAADIQLAYADNVHGDGTPGDVAATAALLRADMGYTTGTTLDCDACHDPHGASNAFALKESVVSQSGDATVSGLSVVEATGAGGGLAGYDMRFFCSSCHVLTAASHASLVPTSEVDLARFPIDCTRCHKHMLDDGSAGGTGL